MRSDINFNKLVNERLYNALGTSRETQTMIDGSCYHSLINAETRSTLKNIENHGLLNR